MSGMIAIRPQPQKRVVLAVSVLLCAASATLTMLWSASMSAMGEMLMPGGWTMSMTWMRMPGQTWTGVAASFIGMWVVMMVAMMLPSLVPVLWRYSEAAGRTGATRVGLLTTLEREGRYRRLSTENVDQLRLIAHCRGLGFTLREIREVLRAVAAAKPACPDPVTMLAVVERRLRALDAQVARLQLLGKRLGAARAYLRRRRRA